MFERLKKKKSKTLFTHVLLYKSGVHRHVMMMETRGIVLLKQQITEDRSDYADGWADLSLCFSYMHKAGFLMMRLK